MGVKIIYHDTIDGCAAASIVKNEMVNPFDQQIIEYTRAGLYSNIEVYGTNENDIIYIIGIPMSPELALAIDAICTTGAKVIVIDNHPYSIDYINPNYTEIRCEEFKSLAMLAFIYTSIKDDTNITLSDIEFSEGNTHWMYDGIEHAIPEVLPIISDIGIYENRNTEWFERGLMSQNHAPDARVWIDLIYNNPRVIYDIANIGQTMTTPADRIVVNDIGHSNIITIKDDKKIAFINTTNTNLMDEFKKYFTDVTAVCCFHMTANNVWVYHFSGVVLPDPKFIRNLITEWSINHKKDVIDQHVRDNNNGYIKLKKLVI